MRFAGLLFSLGAVFFLVVGVIYGVWSQDWAGTTFLIFTAGMAAIIGYYTLYTSKRLTDLPEDEEWANQDEADPDYGFYSPYSWWPLPMGFGAFMIALGLIFATWLFLAGLIVLMLAIVGLVFEYYRGAFAH